MRGRTKTCRLDWRSLLASFAIVSAAGSAAAQNGMPPCLQCITVRLEHPVVVRGPSPHEPDAPVSAIKLPDGRFRGFIAGGTTLAVDGSTPAALGGQGAVVLTPGPPGSPSDCGRWMTSAMQGLGVLYGLIHNETRCDDPKGSYKWMSIARSEDYGLTWQGLGGIISTDDADPTHSQGEGDCTAVDGHDGYWYAYCLRRRDDKNVVARAPIENPGPGQWFKWSGRGWDAPALGGTGAALDGFVGMSSAYWTGADVILLLATLNSSLQLSISEDKVHFGTIEDPLILYDEYNWKRPAPTELYAYPSMVADRGLNNISKHFFLTYMYVPPNEDFTHRYLVAQEGWIAAASAPQYPQVRTALSRWVDADGGTVTTWTTSGPTLSPNRSYRFDRNLGYVMTAPPPQGGGVKLDECFSETTGIGFLAPAGRCAAEGSARRRPGGYLFQSEQPGTTGLYGCLADDGGGRFVSQRSDCEGKGVRESLLGFALK
jgi:hypothetical protein